MRRLMLAFTAWVTIVVPTAAVRGDSVLKAIAMIEEDVNGYKDPECGFAYCNAEAFPKICEPYVPKWIIMLDTLTGKAFKVTPTRVVLFQGLTFIFSLILVIGAAVIYGPNMKPPVPRYWTHRNRYLNRFKDSKMSFEVDVTEEFGEVMQAFLTGTTKRELMGQGRDGRWATHKGLKVEKVYRIENGRLWTKYWQTREHIHPTKETLGKIQDKQMKQRTEDALNIISKVHKERATLCGQLVAEFTESLELDESRNERLLFHGSPMGGARNNKTGDLLFSTNEESPMFAIKTVGFDERLGNVKGMYGSGTYFAEMAGKADQYAGMYNELGSQDGTVGETAAMFVSRVTLGTPYKTEQALEGLRRPPSIEEQFDLGLLFAEDLTSGIPWRKKFPDIKKHFQISDEDRFDCVMQDLQCDGKTKLFREYVVYDTQCYPEFLITYKRLA